MNRSNSFIEELASDKADPTEKSHYDFDFAAVESAFGVEPLSPDDSERVNKAISFILDWLLKVDLNNTHALKTIGKRAIAMAWVINPDRLKIGSEKQSSSLRQLSKQLGFTAPNIAPLTSEFSRLTKLTNRFQLHDSKNHYANN